MQSEVFHNRGRCSAAAEAPKLKKRFKPKATQTCQSAISASMAIRHSAAQSGELRIYCTLTALSSTLSARQHSGRFCSGGVTSCLFSSRIVCFCYKRFPAKTCILCHTYRLKLTSQFLKSFTLCVGLKCDNILILWSHV